MAYKRKKLNLSVKRHFQIWLLIRILGTVLLSSLVAALILYFYSRHEIATSFYDAHIKIRRVSDLLLPVVAAGSVVSLLSGMALALFLPQKIAGPIYRIENGLREISHGNLTIYIKLRRGDILKDLASSVNNTAATLRDKAQDVKDVQAELEAVVAGLGHAEAAEIVARQKRAIDAFRT